MEKDLRKKLEDAADIYAKRIWENLLEVQISKTDFLAGAEQGYKKAIAQAKEWLKSSFFQCLGEDDNIYWDSSYDDITEALESFETDMNKLLEEKK